MYRRIYLEKVRNVQKSKILNENRIKPVSSENYEVGCSSCHYRTYLSISIIIWPVECFSIIVKENETACSLCKTEIKIVEFGINIQLKVAYAEAGRRRLRFATLLLRPPPGHHPGIFRRKEMKDTNCPSFEQRFWLTRARRVEPNTTRCEIRSSQSHHRKVLPLSE